MAEQQFCLRWNDHQSTLISVFDTLLENEILVDCTLAAEGQYLKAHRVVLSACSPYLETLLSQHYGKHPILILKDVKLSELKSLMGYMYRGEVNISQDQLGSFLKAAESLQIKGLSGNETNVDATYNGSSQPVTTTPRLESPKPVVTPESAACRSSDSDIKSPPSRKRKKINSNDFNSAVEGTNNSCDIPSRAQLIPMDTYVPLTVTPSTNTFTTVKKLIIKPEHTDIVKRINISNLNSLPFESGLLREKIEPHEPLLEPKYSNTEDIVEDLTLNDDDDEGVGCASNISYMPNMSSTSRSGHGKDLSDRSNEGLAPWQSGGNQTETGNTLVAGQEAASTQSDSQSLFTIGNDFQCLSCGKSYQYKHNLIRHQRYECGDKRPFACSLCAFTSKQKTQLKLHVLNKHNQLETTRY